MKNSTKLKLIELGVGVTRRNSQENVPLFAQAFFKLYFLRDGKQYYDRVAGQEEQVQSDLYLVFLRSHKKTNTIYYSIQPAFLLTKTWNLVLQLRSLTIPIIIEIILRLYCKKQIQQEELENILSNRGTVFNASNYKQGY